MSRPKDPTICDSCRGRVVLCACGTCEECGGMTAYSMHRLCNQCATKEMSCRACRTPMERANEA